jgi:hypothetical protein
MARGGRAQCESNLDVPKWPRSLDDGRDTVDHVRRLLPVRIKTRPVDYLPLTAGVGIDDYS